MPSITSTRLSLPALALLVASPFAAFAQSADSHDHDHDHDHGHEHAQGHDHAHDDVSRGYFEDSAIAARPLSDWQGDWQSVYPYLQDGTLDAVMAHKAENGDQTAEEYRAKYETGYKTDVDRIEIEGQEVTFHRPDGAVSGTYASDGYEVLTYDAGNRGVRFIFEKQDGDAEAPAFIQFSDHRIAPEPAGHYHLYWGDDRAALLEELTNWPTYYPADLTGNEIAHEMMAH